MRLRFSFIFSLFIAVLVTACTEDTGNIGGTITDSRETPVIMVDTFNVSAKTIMADSLYARNTSFYLGSVTDRETGDIVNSSYFVQFHAMESFSSKLTDKSQIISKDKDGNIVADSCQLRVYFNEVLGDSTATPTLYVYEMDRNRLLTEKELYYTNFNVESYARDDAPMAVYQYETDDTVGLVLPLNFDYTSQEDNPQTYNNFGTYLLRNMYAHPTDFNSTYQLAHKYLPGFYLRQENDGSGKEKCSEAYTTQLVTYYTYINSSSDTVVASYSITSTEEALQFSHIEHDKATLAPLVNDKNYAYIKTPAGLFTEITIPCDSIFKGHEKDTVNSVRLSLTGLTDETGFDMPDYLLLLPKAVMYSFFEDPGDFIKEVYAEEYKTDSTSNYLNTFVSANCATVSSETYTYANISKLLQHVYKNRTKYNDEFVLVPIEEKTSSSAIIDVNNDMDYGSTRFLLRDEDGNSNFKVSVFYSRYE